MDRFTADSKTPICALQVKLHIDTLTPRQKLYALHMSRAAWHGQRIVLAQVSPESPVIFDFLLSYFQGHAENISDQHVSLLLAYSTEFLGNGGNYKSFGDTKFIPPLSIQELDKLVSNHSSADTKSLYAKCRDAMFSLEPTSVRSLGFPDKKACSAYYSANITESEIATVQAFLESKQINAYNTRLFKDDNTAEFTIRLASADRLPTETFSHQGQPIHIAYGDFSDCMSNIVKSIEAAMDFVENDCQLQMLKKYALSFKTGSIDAHKDSQRFWIKDVGPVVETNLGFIESYRDPAGVRAEWEGFVAVVNKEQTLKFEKLVNSASALIKKLPWGEVFERDVFHKPDFTSLEIVAFCTSGIPAGINIPNYDDIRQADGFKNVSLGNILNARVPNEEITFLSDKNVELFKKYHGMSFEVQVGIHELLGHGSGKLLEQKPDGSFNFDPKSPPLNPLTGKPVSTWYKPGETYSSKFGNFASSYEECRAEAVGIFLSLDLSILKIFGHEGQEAKDVLYTNWLLMVRAGLVALEFYSPETKKWGQAHCQARYAILRVLLEAENGLVTLHKNYDVSDARIDIDETLIETVGQQAISVFLQKLQVYKASADYDSANELFSRVTDVPDDWLSLRDLVIRKRQPRKVFCQPNLNLADDDKTVTLKEYPPTALGMIQSFIDRQC